MNPIYTFFVVLCRYLISQPASNNYNQNPQQLINNYPPQFTPQGFSLGQQQQRLIKQSPNDPRKIEYRQLDNGLQVVLVSDPEADYTAVSALVSIGTLAEPDQYLGLAHYLEHILFMGTKKYPDVAEYTTYIQQHGGSMNAATGDFLTVFYFTINNEYYGEAMDRLSQFFIDPIFDERYVDKERNAVNSEYNMHLSNDAERAIHVAKLFFNPRQPFRRFGIGNLETLPSTPALRQAAIDFYHQHYQPQNMILSVVGPARIEELEQKIGSTFGQIPSQRQQQQQQQSFPQMAQNLNGNSNEPLILPENLGTFIEVESLRDVREITLFFNVQPEQSNQYKTKSVGYVSAMLHDNNVDSLLDYLKVQQGLVDGLLFAYQKVSDSQGLLAAQFGLTKTGFEQIDQVLGAFFYYLRLIEQQGILKWKFDEFQESAARDWKFLSKSKPMEMSEELVEGILDYGVEDALFNKFNFDNFSETMIRTVLQSMTPEKAIYVLLHQNISNGNNGDVVKEEHFFKAQYKNSKIQLERMNQWKSMQFPIKLSLQPNPFLVKVADIKDDSPLLQFPVAYTPLLITNTNSMKIWCLNSYPFPSPLHTIHYSIQVSNAFDSPENQIMMNMLNPIIDEEIGRRFYQAQTGGNLVLFSGSQKGLHITIETYNKSFLKQLAVDLNKMLTNFTVKESAFNRVKVNMLRSFQNQDYENPLPISQQQLIDLLLVPSWPTNAVKPALELITIDKLQSYLKSIFDPQSNYTTFEALIMGPFDCHNSIDINADIIKPIIDSSLPSLNNQNNRNRFPIEKFYQIQFPPKTYVVTVDTKHEDDSLMYYYQPPRNNINCNNISNIIFVDISNNNNRTFFNTLNNNNNNNNNSCNNSGDNNFKTEALILLVDMIFQPIFFDLLRNKQQLGYVVNIQPVTLVTNITGISFAVESSPGTYTPSELYRRFKDFFQVMQQSMNSRNISAENIDNFKTVLKRQLLTKPQNRDDILNRAQEEIGTNQYRFDRRQRLADAVDQISIIDLFDFVNQIATIDNSNTSSSNGVTRIIFRTAENQTTELDSFEQIENLTTFKQKYLFNN